MQRYHAANSSSAVNNSTIGLASTRENARAEAPTLPSSFPLNARRPAQQAPYKLKCEKEHLNSRLGPPDYHPQTPDCPEETLTREYVQSGYKEMVEGLEEAREILLSQVEIFTKPIILKCKETIRKRLRAINESRAKKRKAGQVYGVPLSGSLLSRTGSFPEQRPCSEDFRRRWIEGLSQPHRRLYSLADHIPHGYRRRPLFEVLIKNNVPLLRAAWFIKVTYLNQVRPSTCGISSGTPDKSQLCRTELWTKDVIDYLKYLLDEFIKNNSHSNPHVRDRSPQVIYSGSTQQKGEPASSASDGEETSLHFKWWYMVRLLQWHHAEGLLLPCPIIEWVLNQLQEKELLEIFQLLLPIIYGVIEAIVLSQNYVRVLVGVALRYIREPSSGGSYLDDNSRRAYTCSAVVEMLRYMMVVVPDTFVSLDCFPLPSCVVSHATNDGGYVSKASEDLGKVEVSSAEIAYMFRRKRFDALYQTSSFDRLVASIQKRSDKLTKSVHMGNPCSSYAKVVQALDKALVQGDLRGVYKFLFEGFCGGAVDDWIKEVSPCLRSSLKCIGTVNLSFIHTVFFLCEWATCDFRNFRTSPLSNIQFTGRRDFSEVYAVIWFLRMKARDLFNESQCHGGDVITRHEELGLDNGNSGPTSGENEFKIGYSMSLVDVFESPGPLHDILVCWIDQHEARRGEALERLQLLIVELTRFGIFYPQAYVRQLLVSGIMDLTIPVVDMGRHIRHCQVLKLLPEALVHDALKEMKIADGSEISQAVHVYKNERKLVLKDIFCSKYGYPGDAKFPGQKLKKHHPRDLSQASVDHRKSVESPAEVLSFRKVRSRIHIDELKTAISALMQFPCSNSGPVDTILDESELSVKRSAGLMCNKIELTDGCEECRRVKKQKLTEERNSYHQVPSPVQLEDDLWWSKKGTKTIELMRIDPPPKSAKQTSRSRQKIVRKTQSLAQLAAARIDGSQGASTSHVCDNRISCPHHRTMIDGEIPKAVDGIGQSHYGDAISIGKALKRLRFAKRRVVTSWLINAVRQLLEEAEKASSGKAGQFNSRSFTPMDDSNSLKWKLSEDELSVILYLMDVSNDLVLAIKFLLWLLPKALHIPNSTIHSGRNLLALQRHMESHVCEVGEAFLLSSLRRYENTLTAADLIPQTLSALMHRAAAAIVSNGKVSGTSALAYARYLLKKYGMVSSVVEWRKTFKATCDKRLLSELESGQSQDGEQGYAAGANDLDDFLRQKLSSSRLSRVGMAMRDIVQRHIEDAFHFYSMKEKKLLSAGGPKGPIMDKGDEGYQKAQQILLGLMDCIRQTGGAAQEGDPSLVCSAVSAIVGSVGPSLAKIPDFGSGSSYANASSTPGPGPYVAKRILRIHITSLCLLKEALGERQSRVFEVALATEALSSLSGVFSPGKVSRNQYQLSPETHDSNANTSIDSAKGTAGKASKMAAAVSALVIGAVLQGVTSLERMVRVFRLKDGLDVSQFVKSLRSTSNGNTRSPIPIRGGGLMEVYIHWFRLLVGNCRTVSDGLIIELLGEPSILALSRMQQSLPLNLVFPPAYAIFAFLMWQPYILNANPAAAREDIQQLYISLIAAMNDALKHHSFRDVCMRNTRSLYDLIAADGSDAELVEALDLKYSDVKSKGLVPLRARLFLNAIIDCRVPTFFTSDEPKVLSAENEMKLVDKIVHVLNSLQPAKFHWQWLELRLLLNEQALIEKLDTGNDLSLKEVMQSLSVGPDRAAASDNESNVIEIILTRLLVRPDAASLYSEVVHLLGRSLEDSLLLLTKWFLEGNDVLLGRKTVRQRLINIAETKGLPINSQSWKHWGWTYSGSDAVSSRNDLGKRKCEMNSLEEGEVIEEGLEPKKYRRGSSERFLDAEGSNISRSLATEKALIELILLCMDQSSNESHYTFAADLIKQLDVIEQQMNAIARGTSNQAGSSPSAADVPVGKTSSRKGSRGGSPGMAARRQAAVDSAAPSPAALRASVFLRLHFILRSLPVICTDREPSGKNMRHMLASVILHLLGNRLVYEDAVVPFCPRQGSTHKRDVGEILMENQSIAASEFPGERLFDRLLLILHGLLGSSQPSWLKSKHVSTTDHESARGFCGFEKEVAESLQNELESMQLPDKIRWRIQTAMPVLVPSVKRSSSCQPPSILPSAIASLLQPSTLPPGSSNPTQRTSQRIQSSGMLGKSKTSSTVQQEIELEFDSWTLLEDGAGSTPSAAGVSAMVTADSTNLRASSLLKGASRVRRADLTYVGPVDEDS